MKTKKNMLGAIFRAFSSPAKEKVLQDIAKHSVLVYSKTYCPYCERTKRKLQSMEIKFQKYDIDTLPDGDEIDNALFEITKQETVPNIFITGVHIGGNSDLVKAINDKKVQELLTKAKVHFKEDN